MKTKQTKASTLTPGYRIDLPYNTAKQATVSMVVHEGPWVVLMFHWEPGVPERLMPAVVKATDTFTTYHG
jgi:hypothetical protein